MAARILQVAYYDTLQEVRAKMLEAAGYQVTSVLGNDKAMGLKLVLLREERKAIG
jgi:hypothetical protein